MNNTLTTTTELTTTSIHTMIMSNEKDTFTLAWEAQICIINNAAVSSAGCSMKVSSNAGSTTAPQLVLEIERIDED